MNEATWVYRYKYWDEDQQQFKTSRFHYTIEAIKAGLGSVVVESGIKVAVRDMEGDRYSGTGGKVAQDETEPL
jgi:hypothetical protein